MSWVTRNRMHAFLDYQADQHLLDTYDDQFITLLSLIDQSLLFLLIILFRYNTHI